MAGNLANKRQPPSVDPRAGKENVSRVSHWDQGRPTNPAEAGVTLCHLALIKCQGTGTRQGGRRACLIVQPILRVQTQGRQVSFHHPWNHILLIMTILKTSLIIPRGIQFVSFVKRKQFSSQFGRWGHSIYLEGEEICFPLWITFYS